MSAKVLQGPWSDHSFRGRHVLMFKVRGWPGWGRLHLTEAGPHAPTACGEPILNRHMRPRSVWRSWTANRRGWNPGAYKESEATFVPCRRCLAKLGQS